MMQTRTEDSIDISIVAAHSRDRHAAEEAILRLMERHGHYVAKLLDGRIPVQDSEEAAQDLWVSVWRNAGRFDLDRDFRPWLKALTINGLVTAQRSLRARHRITTVDYEVETVPISVSEWEADRQHVLELAKSNDRYSAVVDCVMKGDLDREIASKIGTSRRTVSRWRKEFIEFARQAAIS